MGQLGPRVAPLYNKPRSMGQAILQVSVLYGLGHATGQVNLWVTFQWVTLDLSAYSTFTPHGGYIASMLHYDHQPKVFHSTSRRVQQLAPLMSNY